ncbi:MAG TPA: ABC transporter permease [Nocardioidaceae bacterium]|nr:ABC transporter permease [Nocardioidaceae bacterium]
MTTITQPAPQRALTDVHRVAFARLFRVELRKLLDTRAGKWLLIAIGLLTLLFIVLALVFAKPPDLTYEHLVTGTATPQGFLLPVLAILAVTSEWSQRTGLVTFTLEPGRGRVVSAKLCAVVVLGIAAVLLALALAALANLLSGPARGGSGSWAFGVSGFRDIVILQLIGMIEGFAFGMLFMNSAAAIVLYFVLPIATSIIFNVVHWLQNHLAMWIDPSTTQAPLSQHTMHGTDWVHLLTGVLLWVALPFVIGTVRVLRSEVKSA